MNHVLSYLYVSGHLPRQIERAYASECGAVVLDLEDSVPDEKKDYARDAVAEVTARATGKPTYVRVNSVGSGRCADDVLAVAGPGLWGVRLPKVAGPDDVRTVDDLLDTAGSPATVHLLLESAFAVECAYTLAKAASRVELLGLGEGDLRVDLRCDADGPTMDAARVRVVTASRAAGLGCPPQCVYPDVRDPAGLRESTRRGRGLGFFGRMALHPAQVPVIHEVYPPTADEIAEAREICAVAEAARQRSTSVVITERQGRLVAPPITAQAKLTLELAHALDLIKEPS